METARTQADYVLFYAKVRSFLEDGCCTLKHTCRRIFEQLAAESGLAIDKYSTDLPSGDAPAACNGMPSRRRRGASKAAYRTFYWAFRASDAALMSEAEFVQMHMPLKDHAGNPLALRNQLSEHEDCNCSMACQRFETRDEDGGQQQHPLDDKRLDFITAPFVHSKRHLFYGGPAQPASGDSSAPDFDSSNDGSKPKKVEAAEKGGGESIPLTDAQRIYLTHSLLHRLDIRKELRRVLGPHPGTELCSVDCIYCQRLKRRILRSEPIVLEHLLYAKIFADAFAVHDESDSIWLRGSMNRKCASACCLCGYCGRRDEAAVSPVDLRGSLELPELDAASATGPQFDSRAPQPARTRDVRRQLHKTWSCCCSFQPLHLIRLYFGERLGFYYAWLGHLICNLLTLTIVGLAFLIYGLVNASLNYKTESDKLLVQLKNSSSSYTVGNEFTIHMIQLMEFIRLMFENHLTIPFGCVLTCMSLAAGRYWKKYEAKLGHRWGVHECHLAEKRRPGFSPKRKIYYPVCCQQRKECRRCFGVFSFVLLCVSLVVAVAVSFKVTKLVASQRHCDGSSSQAECIFLAIILPITGHLLIMSLLDWGYSRLAKKLTDWENHELHSDYDSSYAMKAFALRSANNYASLFYISFVRQENAAFGEFTDSCKLDQLHVDCFSLLNVYTAGYVIGKSLIKIVTDILRPCLESRSLIHCLSAPARRFLCTACASFKRAAYAAELRTVAALERQLVQDGGMQEPAAPGGSNNGKSSATALHLARERSMTKEKSRHVLLDEYLEKITMHGYLVIFGSACYLTPLALLIALLIDLHLDAKRQVISHRRPVPHPAPGIGVWNRLQNLLSHAGIFSNGAIVAFSSNSLQVHGFEVSVTNRLILFIVFFGFMYLFSYLTNACRKAQSNTHKMRLKWEYFHVPRILDTESVSKDAVQSLEDLQNCGRWYHVLIPCFAQPSKLPPEAGPHQA